MSTSPMTLESMLPKATTGRRSPGWWGMILLIATEASLFGCFIAAYFYLRSGAPVWPPTGISLPDLTVPIIMSVVLLISAGSASWAAASIRKGDRSGMLSGLGVTLILGAIFLAVEIYQTVTLPFSYKGNAYGSLVYALSGAHDVHIIAGLLFLGFLMLRGVLGHFNARRYEAIEVAVLYWYFVVALWVAIFLTLDVSPYVL